jgi:hypothetical protein
MDMATGSDQAAVGGAGGDCLSELQEAQTAIQAAIDAYNGEQGQEGEQTTTEVAAPSKGKIGGMKGMLMGE